MLSLFNYEKFIHQILRVISSSKITTLIIHILFTSVFHMKLLHCSRTFVIGSEY